MAAFKPLLPIGDEPMLARTIKLFRAVGVEDVLVVVGHRRHETIPVVEKHGARWAYNAEFASGMYSSVKTGVASLNRTSRAFFMLPVDIPLVRPWTLGTLLSRFDRGDRSIVYPEFRKRRGHPPLIGACHVAHIIRYSGEGGLKAALSAHEQSACSVQVADEHVLLDADTPDAYALLVERLARYEVPTPDELDALTRFTFDVSGAIMEHSRMVARISLMFTRELERRGVALNPELVLAVGLLHDIAKGTPDHARVGAERVRRLGFGVVADAIASHRDMDVAFDAPVTEAEVVYLADKFVRGDRIGTLETRYEEAMRRYGNCAEAAEALHGRFQRALRSKRRIEGILGRDLESLLAQMSQGSGDDNAAGILAASW
jgi:putative nucleotidyltransferase with HDIG domain